MRTRLASVYGPGECGMCGRIFMFNAQKVVTVKALGALRPICRPCIEHANDQRAERNLPLIRITPGTYEPEPS